MRREELIRSDIRELLSRVMDIRDGLAGEAARDDLERVCRLVLTLVDAVEELGVAHPDISLRVVD